MNTTDFSDRQHCLTQQLCQWVCCVVFALGASAAGAATTDTAPAVIAPAAKAPAAKIEDLAWMQGAWAGDLGPQQLEERWNEPKAGSLAALVRMTGPEGTSMIELIVVEQQGDSLVLRLQQFNPGFVPRAKPQEFVLSEIGKRKVTFVATGDNPIRKLTYSRPSKRRFQIDGATADGGGFTAKLKAVR